MQKVLIFGAGQIGNFFKDYFEKNHGGELEIELVKTDITKPAEIKRAIEKFKPDVIINTAGKTNLEWCGANPEGAVEVNALGAGNVAKAAFEADVYLIHLSSACIFSSKDENDIKDEHSKPEPRSFYSVTKVWGEQAVEFNMQNKAGDKGKYAILRPRQPIANKLSNKNMLVKMLTFSKFVDTPNTAVVLDDLAEITYGFIKDKHEGTFNVANPGWTTPYRISQLIKKYILPDLEPEKITKAELDKLTPNIRVDAVLSTEKLKGVGLEPRPLEERLEEVVKELGENIAAADKAEVKEIMELTASETKQRSVTNDHWQELYS